MPVLGGPTDPEDARALYEKIRGPPKEVVEEEVRKSLNLTGDARYAETDTAREESIRTPCMVFVIAGGFGVGSKRCAEKFKGYTVAEEGSIKLDAYSAVVIIQLS